MNVLSAAVEGGSALAPSHHRAAPATAAASQHGVGEFFRYHGMWAVGVRLFRRVGFRAKSMIIALTFILPLGWLAWNYFASQADQIAFSAKERVGVTYARAVMPVLQRLHGDTAAGARPDAGLDTALATLAALQAQLGSTLGTAAAHAAFQDALKGNRGAATQALIDLLGVATDGSNLTLDPDIDSYYLMDAAMFRLPVMIEAAAGLRADGAAAAAPGARRLIEQASQLREHQAAMDAGIGKSIAANGDVRAAVPADAARAAVKTLLAGIDSGVLASGAGAGAGAGSGGSAGGSAGGNAGGSAAAHRAQGDRALESLFELADAASLKLDELLAQRVSKLAFGRNLTAAITIGSLLAGLYLFMSFGKVLEGGLKEVARHIDAMRDSDLTTQPHAWGRDETAHLMHTLVEMQVALRRIVTQVRSASDQIVDASSEIASGADDLSARTEKSAANLEQTAAAMEQISVTVRRNGETVGEANRLASANAQAAERGGRIIGEVVQTMERIHSDSSRIGDIIGTIEGIAFQTNILALNAAVEAARAGEQGRGFAVVAAEVRALAQRSAAAAKEIKVLIGSSVDQVSNGVQVVRQAGDSIAELVAQSQRMRGLLDEVAVGAREQTVGVAQSARAVQELDQVTQQNAALVEQTAGAAGTLRNRARELAAEVSQFKL